MISMVIIKFKIPMTNPKRITLPKLENVNDQPSDMASLKFLLSEKIDIKDKPKISSPDIYAAWRDKTNAYWLATVGYNAHPERMKQHELIIKDIMKSFKPVK